jgi:hypothetical protein
MKIQNLKKNIFLNSEISGKPYLTKFFLYHYRFFDINSKSNGTFKNLKFFPISFNSQVSLPLILNYGNPNSRLKILVNCLKILRFFTFQKSFLKKKLVLQQIKKKNSGFVIQTWTFSIDSFDRFYYYSLTILPYMWISYGLEKCVLITDVMGNLTFATDDITFFHHYLDEKHLDWDKQFFFSFNWYFKKIKKLPSKIFFFFLPFIKGLLSRLLWSSICFNCNRGHGGWLPFSKFSKTIFFNNSVFFAKNFWF